MTRPFFFARSRQKIFLLEVPRMFLPCSIATSPTINGNFQNLLTKYEIVNSNFSQENQFGATLSFFSTHCFCQKLREKSGILADNEKNTSFEECGFLRSTIAIDQQIT